jgi:tRNA pseudouridine32 synthase/23S rRNA pseudouridine746 synthase
MRPPLPTVAGVGPSRQWLPAGDWKTVLDFFIEKYPQVEFETWTARMARGEVRDETGRRVDQQTAYRAGACIFYYRELEDEKIIPYVEQVLYQDEHILVADKPHFLPVIPAGRFLHQTLLVRLRKNHKLQDLVPIHRLDRETAGVVLFSVTRARGATTRRSFGIGRFEKYTKHWRQHWTLLSSPRFGGVELCGANHSFA